jgi:hypothetical protein
MSSPERALSAWSSQPAFIHGRPTLTVKIANVFRIALVAMLRKDVSMQLAQVGARDAALEMEIVDVLLLGQQQQPQTAAQATEKWTRAVSD